MSKLIEYVRENFPKQSQNGMCNKIEKKEFTLKKID